MNAGEDASRVINKEFFLHLNSLVPRCLIVGTPDNQRPTQATLHILGPILFLLYINHLAMVSPLLKFISFADNTNVFLSHNSLEKLFEIMNAELIKISEWFNTNRLSLNSDKTNYIVFCSTHRRMTSNNTLYINNTPLVQTDSSKFLGVLIDSHLTWKDHIMLVTKKVSKSIGIIARIKHCIHHKILLKLYYTLIFPYLSYCNIIWGSNYKTRLYNLFILQKRAIRLICNLPRFSSTKASFCKLNLLTLNNINKYQILLFMFCYHHSLLPKTINIHFQTGSQIHGHYTRFSHHYRSHYACINTKEFSIHCIGPVLWNNLPEELKTLYSINSFKYHLKQLLINN